LWRDRRTGQELWVGRTEGEKATAAQLYREGADLIRPYLHLVGRKEADASSPKGRRELETGIARLEASARLVPDNFATHWLLGKAHEARGQAEASLPCFKRAFDSNPNHADVAREYMRACLELGDGAEGVRAARRGCELAPDNAGLRSNLGLALLIAGDVDSA